MPIYEYRCRQCGWEFEQLQKRLEDRLKCPKCGSRRRKQRLPTAPAVHFRGTGFYATDYKGKP
jgi:putative FmdB family regulatory protein